MALEEAKMTARKGRRSLEAATTILTLVASLNQKAANWCESEPTGGTLIPEKLVLVAQSADPRLTCPLTQFLAGKLTGRNVSGVLGVNWGEVTSAQIV